MKRIIGEPHTNCFIPSYRVAPDLTWVSPVNGLQYEFDDNDMDRMIRKLQSGEELVGCARALRDLIAAGF